MLPIKLNVFIFIAFTSLKQSEEYDNLALRKNVTVSKRYNNFNFDPSLAVDGDDSTDLLKCTLTASGQKEAWLTVDLGEVKNLASISFLHGGLGGTAKAIDPSVSGFHSSLNGNGTLRLAVNNYTFCPPFVDPRVEKLVCLNWGYLPDNATAYTVAAEENVRFLLAEYACYKNQALLKDCVFFSREECNNGGNQIFLSCKSGDTLAGFSVYVSDTTDWKSGTLCYQHNMTETISNNVSEDCFTTGRYVTIYNSRTDSSHALLSDFAYINICEANIKGCAIGHYGENCSKCPIHCLNNTCQMHLGNCFDCEDGYTSWKCEQECMNGWYGRRCSLRCGHCVNMETCDHVNGSCSFGCSPGWKGDYCDQHCESGYFGLECKSACNNPHCLNSTACDAISGQCAVGCKQGWGGHYCEECAPTYYGEQCNKSCNTFCQNRICNQTTGYCFSCVGSRDGVLCENENPPTTATANFDANVGFIATSATSVILSILVIGIMIYVSRRKCCPSSKKKPSDNYELPSVTKSPTEYDEIGSKRDEGDIDNNASEYSEIGTVVDTNLQTAYANMS